jgi:serine/threonine-protein kinase
MIGTTINHYKIISRLGKGGMGEVYAAEDTKLKRKVALKLLPEEVSEDAIRTSRFQKEAQAVAALNHPNIVTIHSVGKIRQSSFSNHGACSRQDPCTFNSSRRIKC